jgi:hypothetical protein
MSHHRTTRRARFVLAAALAITSLLAVTGTASANDLFNSYTNPSGQYLTGYTTLNGCGVWYGPIQDPSVVRGSPYFRTIGGAQVSCPTSGHTISITVVEWVWGGTAWYQRGSTASLTLSGSAGFQAETYVGCPGHYGYWTTGAYVVIDGYSYGWLYSPTSDWKTVGC